MRPIKMLGLVAIAALAAMVLVSSGTAFADSACLEDPKGGSQGECPGGKRWEGPIIGLSPEALFILNGVETKCKSEFLADYVKNEGAKIGLLYLILTLTFTECKGGCKKVFAENLPYLLLVLMWIQEHAILSEDEKGRPAVLLETCTFPPLEPINCLYDLPEKTLFNYVLEEKEKQPLVGALFAGNVPLTWAGDSKLCPEKGLFEAKYLIYEDKEKLEGGELFFTAI